MLIWSDILCLTSKGGGVEFEDGVFKHAISTKTRTTLWMQTGGKVVR